MKLLFDQNLSPRLPRLLADIFPDSIDENAHVVRVVAVGHKEHNELYIEGEKFEL